MTEMAVLGVHRPVLSAILSVSSPAVLQARVFDYEDPGEVLEVEHPRNDIRHPLTLGPWSSSAALITSLIEFVVAAAVMLNTLFLVIAVSEKFVLSWGCTRTWPLYVWMFVPFVIHAVASTGYRLTLQEAKTANNSVEGEDSTELHSINAGVKAIDHDSRPPFTADASLTTDTERTSLRHRLHNEALSCVSHTHTHFEARTFDGAGRKPKVGVILNSISGFLGFLHLVFATVVFSGLLFIVPKDAIAQVAMRLMLSAIVCRFLVVFETAGLRGRTPKQEPIEREERRDRQGYARLSSSRTIMSSGVLIG